MKAEIITIGDEILIGQIVDTNSAFLGKQLNKIGIDVIQITSIQDNENAIIEALHNASKRAQVVITTGGLGPTKDDITKKTLCTYFKDELVLDKGVLQHIEDIFEKYIKQPILTANRSQAYIPSKSIGLFNRYGTAPGMWIEQNDVVYISMPGVPFEMKSLMRDEVLPRLQDRFERPYILHKTVLTYGLGESAIAEKIGEWEENLPDFIKLAYLPGLGRVRLRLSARGNDEALLKNGLAEQIEKLYPLIGELIKGFEDENSLEEQIIQLYTKQRKKIAIAESLTGGKIASKLVDVPGASVVFMGSLVCYDTSIKEKVLGVSTATIKNHSVVSEEVAKEMALNIRKLFKSDIGIATTGNAGPSKGDSDAKIGTVCIGISDANSTRAFTFQMGNHRERITEKTVNKSLEFILEWINNV
jgi:nicotinamide-nucleotide amidase